MTFFRVATCVLVLSFAAPALAAPPTATTSPATGLTTSSAVLNGTGTPGAEATTGWFRVSTTDPVTCSDTFGTRVPATDGTDLGSGSVAVPYSITTAGLTSGVTYYFCAIVANASGTAFGAVHSFTIPGPPLTSTAGATNVASTTATLEGSATPVAATTTGWFRYATSDPGTCNDTFGTRAPASGGSMLGSGTSPVAYTRGISGLIPGETYYFCAIAENAFGTTFGAVTSFTTEPAAPVVTTSSATMLSGTSAQLNGEANPGGAAATGWFRYGTVSPGTCNDTFGSRAPASGGSPLGSGNADAPFAQEITGLSPLTTYYYCAIAASSAGTSFGTVRSFTTPTTPTVATAAATDVRSTSAELNGSANPNHAATTGYFRYGLTDPGTCNDTFGSRAPVSGGSALGSGGSSRTFSRSITGLSAGTTYYYCAIATSSEGTAFGAVRSFSTISSPTVTTEAPTPVASTSATLRGAANPNGNGARGYFRYSETSPGTCNDTFGAVTPSTTGEYLGAGTSDVPYSRGISGLAPATTYYYCAIAYNDYGKSFGALVSFTTPASAPAVTTQSPSMLTGTGGQLRASVNPGGQATTGWFRYSTSSPGSCNDSFGTRAPATGGVSLGAGSASTTLSQPVTGLTPATTYYVCAIAENAIGKSLGSLVTFTTPTAPTVTTEPATSVSSSYADLRGEANPNRAATTGYFRYGLTNPGTCDETFGSRAPATGGSSLGSGSSIRSFSYRITGLSAGTTYYYCAVGTSSEGTTFGAVRSFSTISSPTVTTETPTPVASTSATLRGAANPNGNGARGYFRYSETSPGTCNDTFGAVTPSTTGDYLGAGTSGVPYSRGISGLAPATTYYYCAIAYNDYGKSFGELVSFTTPASAPAVTTGAPSMLTGTGGLLRGTVNPGGQATTGWFRYATASPGTCNDTFGTRAPAAGGVSLGAGSASTALSQPVTELTPSTTYYVCAIAENAIGKSFGSVVSFTTPTPPTVTTETATSVTTSSADLRGEANPNLATTTGYFRYGLTDPGTCTDAFGSRAPTTGGHALGAGSSPRSYSQRITGLSGGTTYYYCAVATSAEGTSFGAVRSFRTISAPTVTTSAPTSVTSTTATLRGAANPNGDGARGYFRYSETSPGTCNDTFGAVTPSATGDYLGAGTSNVPYSRAISGLAPATTYYYCAIAYNDYGKSFGALVSFTTPASAPAVTTNSPAMLTGTGGQLRGSVNPGGQATTGWFRYSTASPGGCNDSFGTRAPTTGGVSLGSGSASTTLSQAVTGLTPATTYYVCAIAENSIGKSFGSIVAFTTPTVPTVTTEAATSVTTSSADLRGEANPNLAATTGYFRYGLTDPGTCTDAFGSRAPTTGGHALGSGSSPRSYSQRITGLSGGTTYYYCAVATSAEGTSFGAVRSFRTISAPTVTTSAPTSLTSTTATLRGAANPNGDAARGYFRYSETSPGTCNDTFGAVTPSTTGEYLGGGTSNVAYSRAISGLAPATTYYYCAIAYNDYGKSFGALVSFTTPASAPVVTTSSPSMLTSTGGQLRASVNPGGEATAGWFRYSTASPGTCNDSFGTRAPATGTVSLGSGTASTTLAQAVTGLTPSTTYYVCAIAENAIGRTFGSVVTFTTPDVPTVVTGSTPFLTDSAVDLRGSANPNRAATTGYFRFGLTDPGACSDAFGSRAPTSGGSSLGAGSSSRDFLERVTGLSSGTTYYYCAVATSAEGTAFGAVRSFRTLGPPNVTTAAATSVTATAATLNGSATPNGNQSYGYFRYSATDPGVCNDSFGVRTPGWTGSDASLGSGTTARAYSHDIGGLLPGRTYYFCAIARNSYGTAFGSLLTLTTPAAPPSVTTHAASSVTTTTATLNGAANPNGATGLGWFRYSTTSPGACNDTFGTRAPATGGEPLGSGSTSASFSEAVAGLAPGTTYYYCAIAGNAAGLSFGSVRTFNTTAPPAVATFAATPITEETATLNASATPNGHATLGWFRYATTDPGACDDTFGTRAPAIGGSGLGSGAAPVAFSQPIAGLSPGTTYYFCAIASSSIGTTFGEVLSFTTPATGPTVTTVAASSIGPATAVLNGSANPNGAASTGWFRYSTTNPGACDDTFGTRAPATGGTNLGSGSSPVAYSAPIAGLALGTTYYYCAIASNGLGASVGTVLSFTTSVAPTVTSLPATAVTSTGATLRGSADPNGSATSGWFRYGATNPGSCDDTFGTRAPASGGTSLGSGSSAVSYDRALTGLSPGTTYYYCAIAGNAAGNGYGAVLSFTTTAAPSVTTEPATGVASTTATLHGTGTPNLAATTGWFRYGTTNPGTCDDSFGMRAPATGGSALGSGTTPVSYSRSLSGLSPGTTYYFCAIASSSAGIRFGAVRSFTTPSAPSVTTSPAVGVTSTGATLNGSADPNLAATTGWFRYGTANPGTCNDSFGARAPISDGAALGAGDAAVAYSQTLIGLSPGTTYYYCAIASNAAGTRFGAVLSFSTPAPPSVTTAAATDVSGTGATLHGSANPNQTATTGWFRYATTNPGTCDDTFGIATSGSSLGAGTSDAAFSQALTGLSPATTYYYCAIASNAVGASFGAVRSFTTSSPPSVTTEPPTAVASLEATLNGTASPNGVATTGWFRFSTADPGACNDSFGTRAPATGGAALGDGASSVAFSQALTGLTPGATYYYCAIAESAAGTRVGAVLSFTTPATPAVTTEPAMDVSGATATLHASANPNLAATTGWFRVGTTDPGSCSDTFGTRAPSTGGSTLGMGSSAVAYSHTVTGLMAGTTYYYCAVASSAAGTSYGAVLSFTTLSAPTVTTEPVTALSTGGATLNGSASPNLNATTAWFRYDTTDPGTCDDTFGTRAPASAGFALGAGASPVPYSHAITGLLPATTYYYCAIASSSVGTSFGAVMSFTTPLAPSATTEPATALSGTGATLNGSANPNMSSSTAWFRYDTADPGTCDDTFGTRAPAVVSFALGDGSSAVPYAQSITGLSRGTTYYYCAIAASAFGTSFGEVMSFTTPDAPSVTTGAATAVSRSGATLNGTATPNFAETTAWFRYDTIDPGGCNDGFGTRAPGSGGAALGAGDSPAAYTETLTGLAPDTTYYYCAIATSAEGTSFGAVMSFTTSIGPSAPAVTSEAATDVTSEAATLQGTANPNLAETTAWFRYDTTDPGECDDTFGTRAPATEGVAVGDGGAAVPYEEVIGGLTPATTYYYCAIASNSEGTSYGDVLTLTTEAAPPAVMTTAPTDVMSDSAILNASATPNGAPTNGWFRYGTTDPGECDDSFGMRAPATGSAVLGEGLEAVAYSELVTELMPGAVYYYCAIVESPVGMAFGEIMTFSPGALPPDVTTEEATEIDGTSATLAGTATANGTETTGWFRYGDAEPAICDDTFGTRAPETDGIALGAGGDPSAYSEGVTGLEPNATYYYCAAASNLGGASFGEVRSFTTEPVPPVVRTLEPSIGPMGVTLSGAADPRGAETVAWFRHDTVEPEACDDSFGTRAPMVDGAALGAERAEVEFSQLVQLEPGTHYVCAIASNEAGVSYGEVVALEVTEEDVTPPPAGGCGCRATGSGQRGWLLPLVAAVALLALRRRRRRA